MSVEKPSSMAIPTTAANNKPAPSHAPKLPAAPPPLSITTESLVAEPAPVEEITPRNSATTTPFPSYESENHKDSNTDKHKQRLKSIDFADSAPVSRRGSASSIRFDSARHPSLPQRAPKTINGSRIRNASPPHPKFHPHVAFDTLNPDITKNPGITLSARHNGFHAERRSKTFMVGVDEHKYSEEALEWLLTSMVDDHDTVVCVRVIEKDVKPHHNSTYKEQARQLMQSIINRNKEDKAICIILEYQFGRLGHTFDTMVNVHQPSMLVVGTKGKSNQGMHGMWNTRHSFSKYCLEKSSIPVVVVRPGDVRQKKKDKRARDPARSSYAEMLTASHGVHESDIMDDKMMLETVTQLSSADEASQVAKALALPAEFDPTIGALHYKRHSAAAGAGTGASVGAAAAAGIVGRANSTPTIVLAPTPGADGVQDVETLVRQNNMTAAGTDAGQESDTSGTDDDDDDDEDDDEEEQGADIKGFDGSVGGPPAPAQDPAKKEKLHEMEVGEAAALKKRNTGDLEDDDV